MGPFVFVQVLAQCHEREVVHGDVKPDNIMTTKGCHVTLVDFGMAYLNDGVSAYRLANYCLGWG